MNPDKTTHKIAIVYHCRLSGGSPHIEADHACGIMQEQMTALRESGLAAAASKILVGVNGGDFDYNMACIMAPEGAEVVRHPDHFRGELPTMFIMQQWARENPDWYVFYHHCKGAIHKGDVPYDVWRRRMQLHCVTNWKQCVADLDAGVESCGAHWLTPEQFGAMVKAPFWGGNFWWAKASFLNTLPQLRQTAESREQFYDAESWIGWGPRRPVVKCYLDGWP